MAGFWGTGGWRGSRRPLWYPGAPHFLHTVRCPYSNATPPHPPWRMMRSPQGRLSTVKGKGRYFPCWGSDPASGCPRAQQLLLGRVFPPPWPLGLTRSMARAVTLLVCMDPTQSSETGRAQGLRWHNPVGGQPTHPSGVEDSLLKR